MFGQQRLCAILKCLMLGLSVPIDADDWNEVAGVQNPVASLTACARQAAVVHEDNSSAREIFDLMSGTVLERLSRAEDSAGLR